jgi:hypothetical protein
MGGVLTACACKVVMQDGKSTACKGSSRDGKSTPTSIKKVTGWWVVSSSKFPPKMAGARKILREGRRGRREQK